MRIEGARVLVTGSNRGLGRSLVGAFLDRGAARVFATVRAPSTATAFDSRVERLVLDVTDEGSVVAAAERCRDTDIIINNAASLANTPVVGVASLAAAQLEMDTNYWGVLRMCRAFAPHLAAGGGGAIVNILSIGALVGIPFCGSYCASKAAAWSLTQSVRAELAKAGTTVAAVFPGPIATEMARPGDTAARHPAALVAAAIVDDLHRGKTMIFPDPVSAAINEAYSADPWSLEARFARSMD